MPGWGRAYNSLVSVQVLNRVSLVLAFAGVFVAGVLSLGHALNVSLPCGAARGCDAVAAHATSKWFGTPVAYFGLAAYLALAALAIFRTMSGPVKGRSLYLAGLGLSGAGALLSFYLTYVSLSVIQAMCLWCLASAAIMTLSFVVHALIVQNLAPSVETTAAPAAAFDFGLIGGLFMLSLIGIGVQGTQLISAASQPAIQDARLSQFDRSFYEASGAQVYGSEDAKITIVEFADLLCAACRTSIPEMRRMVDESGGNVRLVFRHFPLDIHPTSIHAAVAAEYAGEKGFFWEFLTAIVTADVERLKQVEGIEQVVRNLGLDPAELNKRMTDTEDPIFNRVYEDLQAAHKLGIQLTPSYIILTDGVPPRSAHSGNLMRTLREPQYQALQ
jgi:protein-disulfide isomerase